jgi:hypothetical protein
VEETGLLSHDPKLGTGIFAESLQRVVSTTWVLVSPEKLPNTSEMYSAKQMQMMPTGMAEMEYCEISERFMIKPR